MSKLRTYAKLETKLPLAIMMVLFLLLACNTEPSTDKSEELKAEAEEVVVDKSPKEMLAEAYQLFKEGEDAKSIKIANAVLKLGKETKNDTLIGGALTSLCRNAQRAIDTNRLADLSEQLASLSASSGDKKWLMYRAHQNAEMWRLIGDMDRAEAFYDESMQISESIGSMGMYTIDHFNKSFVSTAKGEFEEASELIKKYYGLRAELNMPEEDAYGLIALAYLLEQKQNYPGAHEVAVVTRRLFKEQNLFPEPPDERPLLAVEATVREELKPDLYSEIVANSAQETVATLMDKYLK